MQFSIYTELQHHPGKAVSQVYDETIDPTPEEREAGRYQFYGAGILEDLAAMPYEQMIADDVVWVGTPDDVIERIETVREKCEGLTEVAITVNPGGVEHWKSIKTQELFAAQVIPAFRDGAG